MGRSRKVHSFIGFCFSLLVVFFILEYIDALFFLSIFGGIIVHNSLS